MKQSTQLKRTIQKMVSKRTFIPDLMSIEGQPILDDDGNIKEYDWSGKLTMTVQFNLIKGNQKKKKND